MSARTTAVAALASVLILGGAWALVSNGVGTSRVPVLLEGAWDRSADATVNLDGGDVSACTPLHASNAKQWRCSTSATPGEVVSLDVKVDQEASCLIKTPGRTYRNTGIAGGHGCVISGVVIP